MARSLFATRLFTVNKFVLTILLTGSSERLEGEKVRDLSHGSGAEARPVTCLAKAAQHSLLLLHVAGFLREQHGLSQRPGKHTSDMLDLSLRDSVLERN